MKSSSTKNDFYIECKLNYDKGEYFKFELDLVGRHLQHTAFDKMTPS